MPIVAAADIDLLRVPLVKGGCRMPPRQSSRPIVGRAGEVAAVRRAADSERRVHVLGGPAGTGKTAIAIQAATELAEAGRNVYWVTARNSLSLLEGLAVLALDLEADEPSVMRLREMDDRQGLWELIRGNPPPGAGPRAVLVIDNADDPDDCEALVGEAAALPPQTWFTVVTTRIEELGQLPTGVQQSRVGPLGKPACSELILRSIDDVDENTGTEANEMAERTAELLGRLPLALHVAGSQQRSAVVRHTLRGYGGALEQLRRTEPDIEGPVRHVALAVRLGFAAISQEDQLAVASVLSLLASMAPAQPFPIDTLEVVLGAPVAAAGPPIVAVEPLLRRSRRTLRDTGLIGSGVEDGVQVLWIHPLVADAVRALEAASLLRGVLPAGFAAAALDHATEDLAGRGISDFTLALWRLLVPHVQHLLAAAEPSTEPEVRHATFRASGRTVRHLLQRGLHATASTMADRAFDQVGAAQEDDPDRLSALLHRGIVRQARRRYDDAITDISEAASVYRRLDLRADWLQAEHHLATVHHDKGMLADAEPLLRSVFEMRRQDLGEEHPDTLSTRHRLGMVIQAAGRAAEALAHFDGVVAARRRELGDPLHPDVIAAMHSQAYARQAIGGPHSLLRAEREFGEVHKLRTAVLGPTHPNTLMAAHNLAWIEQAKGRYPAAESSFRAVLDVQLRRLEPDHPHTVAAAANLAWTLLQRKQFRKARRLFHRVLHIRYTQLDIDHPDTQTTRGNIAWLTYEEGEWEEAAHRLTRLVDNREATLGPRHPRTLTTRHNLALSLRSQRDYPAAVAEFEKIRHIQRDVIGEDHESTLSTKYNLAVTLRLHATDDSLQKAINLLGEILEKQITAYSSRHPDVVRTREELIATLRQRGSPLDLDRASDEQTPSRAAAALSRHRIEQEYDDEPAVIGPDDPLITAFTGHGTGPVIDPDIDGLLRRSPATEKA